MLNDQKNCCMFDVLSNILRKLSLQSHAGSVYMCEYVKDIFL